MDQQVENGCGKGKSVKAPFHFLFGRVFDAWIIDHPRDWKRFVVDIFNRRLPMSQERKSMVRVTFH